MPPAQARDLAREARAQMRLGLDPIEEGKKLRSALIASRAAAITFSKAATLYIEAHEASWKNAKHRQQWEKTLETYAKPEIGSLLVRDVELPQVLKVLEPIWRVKTETASRLRGRIESVLDWATARGYRTGRAHEGEEGAPSAAVGAGSRTATRTAGDQP